MRVSHQLVVVEDRFPVFRVVHVAAYRAVELFDRNGRSVEVLEDDVRHI